MCRKGLNEFMHSWKELQWIWLNTPDMQQFYIYYRITKFNNFATNIFLHRLILRQLYFSLYCKKKIFKYWLKFDRTIFFFIKYKGLFLFSLRKWMKMHDFWFNIHFKFWNFISNLLFCISEMKDANTVQQKKIFRYIVLLEIIFLFVSEKEIAKTDWSWIK